MLDLVQLGVRWTGAGLAANNKAEQWVGGWMRMVAGRVERALYGSLVAGFRKRRSDGATPDKQGQWECSGANESVVELQSWTSKVGRGASWPRTEWLGGLGRMGWSMSC
jgi:hypothetical protein